MTLNTVIGLRGNLNFDEVVKLSNKLIEAKNPTFTEGPSTFSKGLWQYSNNPGQGFSAWLYAYRSMEGVDNTDGVWVVEDYDEDGEVISEEDLDVNIRLEFDTTYGYSDPIYGGCSSLHAFYIMILNQYVLERGGSLVWQNEYTGELNNGLEGIEEFMENGLGAMEWFSGVKTLIEEKYL